MENIFSLCLTFYNILFLWLLDDLLLRHTILLLAVYLTVLLLEKTN